MVLNVLKKSIEEIEEQNLKSVFCKSMHISFDKYQGAGNDFIIIDNRSSTYNLLSSDHIALLCDRHFGVGADGLILLEQPMEGEFYMKYYNSDGKESSMCGNGGRCFALYLDNLGLIKSKKIHFNAIDGFHEAEIIEREPNISKVNLTMTEPSACEKINSDIFVDTGSPHYVQFVDSTEKIDFLQTARSIRYNNRFNSVGVNVNFAEILADDTLRIRTYERGVEGETLACGTGVTAVAISFHHSFQKDGNGQFKYQVKTLGGNLEVIFTCTNKSYLDVHLIGPAQKVFSGRIEI